MSEILSIIINYLITIFPSLTITITMSLIVIIPIILFLSINKNSKEKSPEDKKTKYNKIACISAGYPPLKTRNKKD